MREVVYFVASSLDGFIARSDGAVDWLFTDQPYGFPEFFETVNTVIVGRKTYEQALTFEERPFDGKEVLVFSRTRSSFEQARVVTRSIDETIAELRAHPGGAIWLVGGGMLAGECFAARAVDRVIVFVHPILLGAGRPLASEIGHDVMLKLQGTHAFETGLVRLDYTVRRES